MTLEKFREKLLSFIGNKIFDKVILSIDDIQYNSFNILLSDNSSIAVYKVYYKDIEIVVYINNVYDYEVSSEGYTFDEFIKLIKED